MFFEGQEWEVPGELKLLCEKAETKDEELKKILEKKLTLDKLFEVVQDVNKEKIRTSMMKVVIEQYEKASRWVDNAKEMREKWVAIKTLQKMVTDAKNLCIMSPLIEEVKHRYDKAHDWYNFIL